MSFGLCLSLSFCWSYHVSSSFWSIVREVTCVNDNSAVLWRRWNQKSVCGSLLDWECHLLSCPEQLKKRHNMILISTWWGNRSSRGNWRRRRRRERELGRTRRSSSPQTWSCWTRRTLCSSEFWGGKKILRRCCLSLLHHVECKY